MGLFGSNDKKNLKRLNKIAVLVEEKSEKYNGMSDDELKGQTDILRGRLGAGETLDDILPDAFAVVREASSRVLKMRHFYVQIIGGIVLHQGRVAEMRTGEGKTLVATLPAYLNALSGNGVHIVTVNDYLARRDAEWMGRLYNFLGLTVGVVCPGMEFEEKVNAYKADITYSTNNELGFDFLRDNMATRIENKLQRSLNFAIVDEVDSILIDEARTPLIISGRGTKSSDLYISANKFVKKLSQDEDYVLDEKEKTIEITEDGASKAESFFKVDNLGDVENTDLNHHIQQALRANYMMKCNSDYIVRDGEVIIVDENTGRLMIGRRYSAGLHQAIEAKEGVKIKSENKTLATITFQNYFRMYKKLSGMTGTAKTEEEEFKGIYNLDVVTIPTNLPMLRVDSNDFIFKTHDAKIRAIVEKIKELHESGQPVLVGTVTVERSEELSDVLSKARIPHNVLNAKSHSKEAEIIAQAGRLNAVTIATNMAGRGTDILLGGNPTFMAREKMHAKGYADEQIEIAISYASNSSDEEKQLKKVYNDIYDECKAITDKEREGVIEAGGLAIIGTERHESRRIDDQLRGRSGRQGDPGASVFYISLEDDLARIFGGEGMQRVFDFLRVPEDMPVQAKILSKQIQGAQKKLESRNYSTRKNVIQYDDVINHQRKVIYKERNKVLEGTNVHDDVLDMIPLVVKDVIEKNADLKSEVADWDKEQFNKAVHKRLLPDVEEFLTAKRAERWDFSYLKEKLNEETLKVYEAKIQRYKELDIDYFDVERAVLLKNVDEKWIEHVDAVDQLRKGASLAAYAQQDPLLIYKKDAADMFDGLIDEIKFDTAEFLLNAELQEVPKVKETNLNELQTNNPDESKMPARSAKTVGRNEPCPCGSGKKYKNCCGANS